MGRVGMTCLLGQAWNRAEAQSCLKGKKVPCTTAGKKKKFSYISNTSVMGVGQTMLINVRWTKVITVLFWVEKHNANLLLAKVSIWGLTKLNAIHLEQSSLDWYWSREW
jgi:hypothetical protein